MSRSALSRVELQRQHQPQQQQHQPQYNLLQVSQPYNPTHLMNMHMMNPTYFTPQLVTGMYPAPVGTTMQQVFVPLVGDDDDYEDPEVKKNVVPMYGNTTNYNINNLLYNNIMESQYFRALYQLRTYHEVLHEINSNVVHVEPWQTGTTRLPSSAYCLLLKLLLMKLTHKQMNGMLDSKNSPLIRAIGLLYLRYVLPPADLWKWYEPYLENDEEFNPSSDKSINMTIGEYCIKLLTDMSYYGTTLPRIPVLIERKIRVMLLLLDQKKKRRNQNMRSYEKGLFQTGAQVKAIYSDQENEPAWYEAVIESIDEDNDMKFWVKFPEYGNTEYVDLGDMELLITKSSMNNDDDDGDDRRDAKFSKCEHQNSRDSRDRDRDRDRHSKSTRAATGYSSRSRSRSDSRRRENSKRNRNESRSRSRSRDRDRDRHRDTTQPEDLMEKVLQSSREASAAVGKNYGQRPASYKGSLSLKMDRFTVRKRSPSPLRERMNDKDRGRDRDRDMESDRQHTHQQHSLTVSKEKLEKIKSLKERYGDISNK